MSLHQFLSHCNKPNWSDRLQVEPTDKLKLSSAQADKSFINQTLQRGLPPSSFDRSSFLSILLASPFYTSVSLLFGCKVGLVAVNPVRNGNEHTFKAD